jgi:G3E family GTPase
MRFVMIGGFLGAGKTTAIARLAKHYVDQGLKVGVVTNDQAYDLVDTHSLRAQGFRVGEVPGACFCCKFNDLISTASELSKDEVPDVIIAEPVGSCTDLVATVIEPLRALHGEEYELAPLAVLLKPEHGQKILRGQAGLGFSAKAAYIFLKQIEEADVIVMNKIDKLSADEREELLNLLATRWPEKRILAVSAKQGEGFAELVTAIGEPGDVHEQFMEVDYDVYAAGEAELGWLNCQAKLSASGGELPLDDSQKAGRESRGR